MVKFGLTGNREHPNIIAMNDIANRLNQAVGTRISNTSGKFLGQITGLMYDDADEKLDYIILKSRECFGRGERFFAIPAKTSVLHVSQRGKIIIHLKKDDLQFAQGIAADQCPKPKYKYKPSVFELYNYGKISQNSQ